MRCQTYGFLSSCKASPLIGWYQIILLDTCVNNLPRVALNSGVAGIPTHDLLIASPTPYHYATEPCKCEKIAIAQFAITINSNVCPHIRVLNTHDVIGIR